MVVFALVEIEVLLISLVMVRVLKKRMKSIRKMWSRKRRQQRDSDSHSLNVEVIVFCNRQRGFHVHSAMQEIRPHQGWVKCRLPLLLSCVNQESSCASSAFSLKKKKKKKKK